MRRIPDPGEQAVWRVVQPDDSDLGVLSCKSAGIIAAHHEQCGRKRICLGRRGRNDGDRPCRLDRSSRARIKDMAIALALVLEASLRLSGRRNRAVRDRVRLHGRYESDLVRTGRE